MKKLISLILFLLLFSGILKSQVPEGMKYQAVIRSNLGEPISNRTIFLRISILEGSASGTIVFSEIHNTETNEFGLVNLTIGNGSGSTNLSEILWGNGLEKWMQIELDSTGSAGFVLLGTTELLSVPYAFFAGESTSSGISHWQISSGGIYYEDGNVGIGTNNPNENAALEIQSNNKGFLPPRLSNAQRDAIDSPSEGLTIFNTDTKCLNVFKNAAWYQLCGDCIPPPNPVISSNSPVCESQSIFLYATNTGGAEVLWTGPNGFVSNLQNPTISNASDINSGYYKIITSNSCGSSNPDSVLVNVQDLPDAAGTITGLTTVCEGNINVSYSISAVNYASGYTWEIPAGAVITSGSSTNNILVNYLVGSISGFVKVTPYNSCGNGVSSPNLTVNVIPQPDIANAGEDMLNIPSDFVVLGANIPVVGTGEWSIVSGIGGSFDNNSEANTVFHGIQGNNYELSWEISNSCNSSSDNVNIGFAPPFTCGDSLVDFRDGQKYATVQIGTQCWMAQNLNIGIQQIASEAPSNNGIIEKYCYADDSENCEIYGGLYRWTEMMQLPDSCETHSCAAIVYEQHQGICPAGWHVPSDEEFMILEMELGMTEAQANLANTWRGALIGDMLKLGGSTGFDGLLSGRYSTPGSYSVISNYEYPHTSTEYGANFAWRRCLRSTSNDVGRWNTFPKSYGLSVRCLKDY
ncbi:MAG: hypothetical protein JXR58_08340 [Bacteroidales bacterium]|nr:hypothetical protein [Bacteroidales bacterium]